MNLTDDQKTAIREWVEKRKEVLAILKDDECEYDTEEKANHIMELIMPTTKNNFAKKPKPKKLKTDYDN